MLEFAPFDKPAMHHTTRTEKQNQLKLMTWTSYNEARHQHEQEAAVLQRAIFEGFRNAGCAIEALPGTTAFKLMDVVIQAPYRETTCISLTKDLTGLAYAKTIIRGIRRDIDTKKRLAELPEKRVQEESKLFNVQAFLEARRPPKQHEKPMEKPTVLGRVADVYNNAARAKLPLHQTLDRMQLQQQEIENSFIVPKTRSCPAPTTNHEEEKLMQSVRAASLARKRQIEASIATPELIAASDEAFKNFAEDISKLSKPAFSGHPDDVEAELFLQQQSWPTYPFEQVPSSSSSSDAIVYTPKSISSDSWAEDLQEVGRDFDAEFRIDSHVVGM